MDFTSIVLFLAIYYLKPQEWTSVFAQVRFVQLTMIAAIASLFFRARSVRVADFFRTPHDWAMFAFFGWVVVASATPVDTFREFLNRLVFYVVVVQTLTSWNRIVRFLGWWTTMIMAIAFLAIAGEYFFDPLGSYGITHGIMKDRLVLNLSMVNNPNALGHTVVPVIPMLYYFCIWKRPLFMKEVGLATYIIPLMCVYLTFSKGAYLAGAISILATLTFGRPKILQILIVSLTLIAGVTAVQSLPRMGELQKSKTDEAIQGRIQAFTYGRGYYDHLTFGVGQGNFIKSLFSDHGYYKAAHSTYVQTGAELGKVGMFFFLLVIWTSFRTLIFAKTWTVEQERIRRILFVLLLTYCVSGWMVDFAYRATFFLFTAAVAAFHRLLYQITPEVAPEEKEEEPSDLPWRKTVVAPLAPAGASAQVMSAPVLTLAPIEKRSDATPWLNRSEEAAEPEPEMPKRVWNRLGWLDFAAALAMIKLTEYLWTYAIVNF